MSVELVHTSYRVSDLDTAIAFYEALGLELRGRMEFDEGETKAFMGAPGHGPQLELSQRDGEPCTAPDSGYDHIALAVDDLRSLLERLEADGVRIEGASGRRPRMCFTYDPDGYRVELLDARAWSAISGGLIG